MKVSQVAVQLFTCMEYLKTPADIAETLKKIRQIGYQAVQVSGMGPIPERDLVEILDGEGLTCCATHEPAKVILERPEAVVERLQKLHCQITAYPFPVEVDLTSPPAVEELIRRLDRSGKVLADAELTLCYHNHNQEFYRMGDKTVLDRIYEGTSPRNLQGEPDTFWIQYGGGDCVDWCEKLEGRLPLIHLKDYATDREGRHQICEIGSGNLNFGKIIAAAEKSGCQWFVVEQDTCPGHPLDSLEKSFRYLEENLCQK